MFARLYGEHICKSMNEEVVAAPSGASFIFSRDKLKDIGRQMPFDTTRVPIIVNAQRIILDGYTRFRACKELQIVPRIMIRQFEGPLQEKQFIIQINRNRRHLTTFQRVELEPKYQTIQSELAKKRMSEAGKTGAQKDGREERNPPSKIGYYKIILPHRMLQS